MATIREAFEYAAKNPNSDFAKNLSQLASSGSLDIEAKANGIDLTPFKQTQETPVEAQPKKDTITKIASFTGGEELGQGIGQTLANTGKKGNFKTMEKDIETANQVLTNLIKQKKANQKAGKDNTRIMEAIANQADVIQQLGGGAGKIFNPNDLTAKSVVGDALQLGTTVIGAGKLPGAAKTATSATSVGKGIVQGAKAGAKTGLVFGASTGVSQGLQENLTGKEIAQKGVTGAITGGITGGIVGGAIGGVSGGIRGAKLKKTNTYLDAVTPNAKDFTPTEYEKLLNSGKISPKTSTGPAKYILSEEEKQVALKYKSLFGNDPVKNTKNIIEEIAKKDAEVGKFLKSNNGIFNTGELKNNLMEKLSGIDDLTVSTTKLNKAKTDIVNNFIKSLDKKDMESLWTARKAFDRQIEKSFSGSPTLQNTMKREFRNAVQDFISERTPDGVYKSYMKDMTQLFNLKDITNTKAVKEKGMNAIQLWIKRNPNKAKILGYSVGTGIVGTVAGNAFKN